MHLIRRIIHIGCYALLVALIVGYFAIPSRNQNINVNLGRSWDTYDPNTFYKLLTVNKIVAYADSVNGGNRADTLQYVRLISDIISDRFYHGYSHYSFRHNWIAFTAGKTVWDDLNAIVLPDDILQYSNAACSQVSIVLAACLRQSGISYRKVSFTGKHTGHFALEARVNGQWCFVDANKQPRLPEGCHSAEELIKSGAMEKAYDGRLAELEHDWFYNPVTYGEPNAPLAPRASIFHRVTYWASVSIPLLLLAMAGYDLRRFLLRRKSKARAEEIQMGNESVAVITERRPVSEQAAL